MSKDKKSKGKKFNHIVEELEAQFHSLHGKLVKAKDDYLKRHEKEVDAAKKKVEELKKKLAKASDQSAKAAEQAKKSGSKAAKNQWKKTKAAAALLADSLKEARQIMTTAEDKLASAKPFDKKLAARAKALEAFEKEWAKKMKAEEEAKAKKAAARKKKAPAKKKKTASKKTAASKKKATAKEKPATPESPPTTDSKDGSST